MEQEEEEEKSRNPDGNFARVIHRPHDDEACARKINERRKPEYPSSALYEGYVGSVLVQVDIDEDGKISNPQILAAVPEEYFGKVVLESVVDMRYSTGKTWDPAVCSLAEKGHIITFQFVIP
jgi:TonB family protein